MITTETIKTMFGVKVKKYELIGHIFPMKDASGYQDLALKGSCLSLEAILCRRRQLI